MPETNPSPTPDDADQPTRLVVGMSRAGTTWVCKELSRHPDVISYGETMLWGRKYAQPDQPDKTDSLEGTRDRLRRSAQHFIDYIEHARVPERRERYESSKLGHIDVETLELIAEDLLAACESVTQPMTPAQTFARMNSAVCTHTNSTVAIESTPNHLNELDRIFDAIPDALVVAMLRGPYAFMVSYKHQGDRKEESVRRTFRRLYHPLFCALIWSRYSKSARAAIASHRGHVRTIWLDELQSGGGSAMRELAEFFQLPNPGFYDDQHDHKTHKNTSFPGGKKPALSHADMFWMNLIGSGEMKRHNITKTPSGFHPIRVLGSLITLPISAFHVVRIMGKRIEGSPFAYAKKLVFGK